MESVQPLTTGIHEPGSNVFASELKLNANGSVQPKIVGIQGSVSSSTATWLTVANSL